MMEREIAVTIIVTVYNKEQASFHVTEIENYWVKCFIRFGGITDAVLVEVAEK